MKQGLQEGLSHGIRIQNPSFTQIVDILGHDEKVGCFPKDPGDILAFFGILTWMSLNTINDII